MPNTSSANRYGAAAQALHWIIAALIVTQFVLASMFDDLPLGMQKLALIARHKSFGMTVLMLAILRVLWRLGHAPPPLPAAMSALGKRLAQATHAGFYFLLFAMPLSGWLMSSAKNYSVSWFGLFTWPNLIGPGEDAFNAMKSTHDLLAKLLFGLAILHVAAALKHYFVDKDDVLQRMLPFVKAGRGR